MKKSMLPIIAIALLLASCGDSTEKKVNENEKTSASVISESQLETEKKLMKPTKLSLP